MHSTRSREQPSSEEGQGGGLCSLRGLPFLRGSWELGFPASTPKHRLDLWVPPWGPKLRPTICLSPHYMQNHSWAPEWNGQDSNRIGHNPFSRGHILRIELSDTGSQHGSPQLYSSNPALTAMLSPFLSLPLSLPTQARICLPAMNKTYSHHQRDIP